MGISSCKSEEDDKKIISPKIKGIPNYIPFGEISIIEKQKEYNVCKVVKKNKFIGTGFLCLIPYPNRINLLPVLITCNHVLGLSDLQEGNEINLVFNDKINKKLKIEKTRAIYTSDKKEYDTTIIEIKKIDGFNTNNMLEIDYDTFQKEQLENLYKNKSIYIIHYPKGNTSSFSNNIIKNIGKNYLIEHLCATEEGSSGAPILNILNLKVIGIHKGSNQNKNVNLGTFISAPIDKFNLKYNKKKYKKQNYIIITVKINKDNIGKKIYFLEDYDKTKEYCLNEIEYNYKLKNILDYFLKINIKNEDEVSRKKEEFLKSFKEDLKDMNETNVKIYINDKEYSYKKYFIPEKEGTYIIKLELNFEMKDCSYMFCGCEHIKEIDFSFCDTKNVTDMKWMFKYCSSLKFINFTNFDTSKVSNMSCMFSDCKHLGDIDLSTFDTKNVINMSYMFAECENLLCLDLSHFDTKNVTDMSKMFYYCIKLKYIDLPFIDSKNIIDMYEMFYGCKKLKEIDLSSFNINKNNNILYLFENCDNLETVKISKSSKRIQKENKENENQKIKYIFKD